MKAPIKTSLERVTPEMAETWLELNTKNRPLSPKRVRRLAEAIQRGEWEVNGESIKFNCDGSLIDGQHRLAACVSSGRAIETMVVRGLPRNTFTTIDRGRARTLGDDLALAGEEYYRCLAAALTVAWQHDQGEWRGTWTMPTATQAQRYLKKNPGLRESAAKGFPAWRLLSPAIASGMHYLFSRIDPALADEFIEALVHGANLATDDPFLRLRNRLLRERTEVAKLRRSDKIALCIKAWNARRKGEKPQILIFKSDVEKFPEIA